MEEYRAPLMEHLLEFRKRLMVAFGAWVVGFIIAYHTYGRWLARKILSTLPSVNASSMTLIAPIRSDTTGSSER